MKESIILKKNGDVKEKYVKLLNKLETGKKVFHLKYWTGTNRHRTLVDTDYYNMITLLKELGIKYELGNDAPKGGVTGDFIKIKSDKRNKNYRTILEKEVEK